MELVKDVVNSFENIRKREVGLIECNQQVIGLVNAALAKQGRAALDRLPAAERGTSGLINQLALLLVVHRHNIIHNVVIDSGDDRWRQKCTSVTLPLRIHTLDELLLAPVERDDLLTLLILFGVSEITPFRKDNRDNFSTEVFRIFLPNISTGQVQFVCF